MTANGAGKSNGMCKESEMGYVQPDKFMPLGGFHPDQQKFVKQVISEVTGNEKNTFLAVAHAVPDPNQPQQSQVLYSQTDILQTLLKGTTSALLNNYSWFMRTLAFIRDKEDKFAFTAYSLMPGPDLTMKSPTGNEPVTFIEKKKRTPPPTSRFKEASHAGQAYVWEVYGPGSSGKSFVTYDQTNDNAAHSTTYDLNTSATVQFTVPPLTWTLIIPGEPFSLTTNPELKKKLYKDIIDPWGILDPHISVTEVSAKIGQQQPDKKVFSVKRDGKIVLTTSLKEASPSDTQCNFVFLKTAPLTYQVFTASTAGLIVDTATRTHIFAANAPTDWTLCEFIRTADEDYWLWGVKGEGLYLCCAPSGDIGFTEDSEAATEFKFPVVSSLSPPQGTDAVVTES